MVIFKVMKLYFCGDVNNTKTKTHSICVSAKYQRTSQDIIVTGTVHAISTGCITEREICQLSGHKAWLRGRRTTSEID